MTPAARKIADAWDPAKEEASGDLCKSYGAPALLRVPGRLHITWQDDQTLRMETDAGKQTRTLSFRRLEGAGAGRTRCRAIRSPSGKAAGAGATDGIAEGHDDEPEGRLSAQERRSVQREREAHGILRPDQGAQRRRRCWSSRSSTTDPLYLRQPFVITSQFKKEAERRQMESDGVLGDMVRHRRFEGSAMTRIKSLSASALLVRERPRAGGDRSVGILGVHQPRGRARARRRPEPRRLGRTAVQRIGARQGPEFLAVDHLDAGAHLLVPDAVAHRGRTVQPQDVGRARSDDRQGPGVGGRRMGDARADDDLDGRASASVEERAARSDRLHHRRVERQRADRHHDAPEDRLHAPQRRGQQRPGHDHDALPAPRRPADASRCSWTTRCI